MIKSILLTVLAMFVFFVIGAFLIYVSTMVANGVTL